VFKGGEEKCAVAANGSADGDAWLVPAEVRPAGCFHFGASCVQVLVLMEESEIAMPQILSGVRDHVH
jgi:hypothetical protein